MYIQRVYPTGAAATGARPLRSTWTTRALLGFAALLSLFALTSSAHAAVNVSGNINADTTWTAANSPYTLTGSVTVPVGVTLTIEPGATVVGAGSAFEITVRGTLNASGTAEAPILFRGNNPGADAWEGINVPSGGRLTLRHAEVRDADVAVRFTEPRAERHVLEDLYLHTFNTRGISASAATSGTSMLTVVRARMIGDGQRNTEGLYLFNVYINLSESTISGHRNGATVVWTSAMFRRCIFADNRRTAVETTSSESERPTTTFEHCTLVRNGASSGAASDRAAFIHSSSTQLNPSNLVVRDSVIFDSRHLVHNVLNKEGFRISQFARNVWTAETPFRNVDVPDDFALTDNLQGDALFVDALNGDFRPTDRSPARFWSLNDPANTAGALPFDGAPTGSGLHGYWYQDLTLEPDTTYDVLGDMAVAAGATLSLAPGTTLRMAAGSDLMAGGLSRTQIEIDVHGHLLTQAPSDRPVVLTSASIEPLRGDWYGIKVFDASALREISRWDVGYGTHCIVLNQFAGRIADTHVHHCSGSGLTLAGGTPVLEAVVAEYNSMGVRALDGAHLTVQIDAARRGTVAGLTSRYNSFRGVDLDASDADIANAVIHDHVDGSGIYVTSSGNDIRLNVTHTIISNNRRGIVTTRTDASSLQYVSLDASAVTSHSSSTITRGDSTRITCSRSNIWNHHHDNASDIVLPPGTCFSENPLYTTQADNRFRPTRWSPHRRLGPSGEQNGAIGGIVGPFDYAGSEGPQVMGYIWEDHTFTRQGSPYTLLGDLTVPAGVTVTIEPGVEFHLVRGGDGMSGGAVRRRTEVRFLAGSRGILGVAPGDQPALGIAGEPIVFRPDGALNAPPWSGLAFDNGAGSSIHNVRVEGADTGLHLNGPGAPVVKFFKAEGVGTSGIHASNIPADQPLWIHGAHLTGIDSSLDGLAGIRLQNATARIGSSFAAHFHHGLEVSASVPGSVQVDLAHTTFLRNTVGLYYGREHEAAALTVDAFNTIVTHSQRWAFQDSNPSIPTTDRFYRASLFNTAAGSGSADVYLAVHEGDVHIEDADWDDLPRWADGQVWPESPAIDAGDAGAPPFPVPTDILGRPRVVGAAGDLGAWEFDPAANREPRADAVTAAVVAARGERFTLDGSGAYDPDGPIALAFWTFSDGTVAEGLTVHHTFADAGAERWAYLTIVDEHAAEDHARVQITVKHQPVAEAGPPQFQGIEADAAVQFDGELSTDPDGAIVAWLWDFGDGSTSDVQSPRHAYLSAGLYSVRLTVTDDDGLSHTDTTLVTVAAALDTSGPLIDHTEIEDGRPANQPVTVRALIRDPSGVASADLLFRAPGAVVTRFVPMQPVGDDVYEGIVPADAVTPAGVEYWLMATDAAGPDPNSSQSPQAHFEPSVYHFRVQGTGGAPIITHTPVAQSQVVGQPVPIVASVRGANGVGSVRVHFRKVNDAHFAALPLVRVGESDTYQGQIPGGWVTEVGVQYYLEAHDTAVLPETSRAPALAPASRYFIEGMRVPPNGLNLSHAPVNDDQIAAQPIAIWAEITTPYGAVTAATLHFRPIGQPVYRSHPLARVEDTDTWRAVISQADVNIPGVEYYLTASSDTGHQVASPAGFPGVRTHRFTVIADDGVGPDIQHIPIAQAQPASVGVSFEATVTDRSGVSSVTAYFRPMGELIYLELPLSVAPGDPDRYQGTLPGDRVRPPGFEYYLHAVDFQGNTTETSAGSPAAPLTFTVNELTPAGPFILHVPVMDGQPQGQDVAIHATVIDLSGVASVILSYRVEGEAEFIDVPLTPGADDTFAGTIPGAAVHGVALEYHLTATDLAAIANTRRDPEAGEHRFGLIQPDLDGPSVEVEPVADEQLQGQPVTVTAVISDGVGLDPATAGTLLWGPPGGPFNQAPMALIDTDTFAATIPGAEVVVPAIAYYVVATDTAGNQVVAPAGAPDAAFTFAVTAFERSGPLIAHVPSAGPEPHGRPVTIAANVTDASGVASVVLSHRVAGEVAFTDLPMTVGAGDTYLTTIPGAQVRGLAIEYHFTATDLAPGANTRRHPAAGEHRFDVDPPDLSAPSLVILPVADGQLQGHPVIVTAFVSDAGGLDPDTAATLFWGTPDRPIGQAFMVPNGNRYTATIPGSDVQPPGIAYYVVATDLAGNVSIDPFGAPDEPLTFTVAEANPQGPTIVHTVVADGQPAGQAVTITATVTDASGVASVVLSHRAAGGDAFAELPMVQGAVNSYAAEVPAFAVAAPGFDYYLSATDAAGNTASLPVNGAAAPFNVSVVADPGDAQAPNIQHTPPEGPIEPGRPFELRATITDATGVGEARLHFRNGIDADEPWLSLDLVPGENDEYTVRVPGAAITGPTLAWYLEARDTTAGRLRAFEPAGAPATYHSVDVEAGDELGPVIEAAVPLSSTAGLPITLSALVTDPSGVFEVTLRHRSPAAGVWSSTPMQPDVQADTYVASVPGVLAAEPGVEVVILAEDDLGNLSQWPPAGEADPWFVTVTPAAELSPPVIVHSPPATAERDAPLALTARISDASGVASARVHCRAHDEDAFEIIDMQLDNGDRWSVTLPATCLAGAQVRYWFEATDASPQANRATEPPDAPEALFQVVTLGLSPDPDQGIDADLGTGDMMIIVADLGPADLGTADQGTEDMGVAADQGSEDMRVAADRGLEDTSVTADRALEDMSVTADLGTDDMATSPADRGIALDVGVDSDLGTTRDGGPGAPDAGNPGGGGGGGGCNLADEQPAPPALLLLGLLGLVRRRRRRG